MFSISTEKETSVLIIRGSEGLAQALGKILLKIAFCWQKMAKKLARFWLPWEEGSQRAVGVGGWY